MTVVTIVHCMKLIFSMLYIELKLQSLYTIIQKISFIKFANENIWVKSFFLSAYHQTVSLNSNYSRLSFAYFFLQTNITIEENFILILNKNFKIYFLFYGISVNYKEHIQYNTFARMTAMYTVKHCHLAFSLKTECRNLKLYSFVNRSTK